MWRVVPEAIESAKANACPYGCRCGRKSRFFCADAGQAATRLAAEGLHPDIVMLDPPPQGLRRSHPFRCRAHVSPAGVVYVSCNPATWARDVARFESQGYRLTSVQPVDMFPQTYHVEVVSVFERL